MDDRIGFTGHELAEAHHGTTAPKLKQQWRPGTVRVGFSAVPSRILHASERCDSRHDAGGASRRILVPRSYGTKPPVGWIT
jgi:hypothetical protein